jgi:NADPH:quinone reductase-like Zn-dependent oxidoreductase
MKAAIWTKYGPPDVLQIREVEKPTPKDNEVLVRICATTVNAGDCEMRSLKISPLLRLPMRLYVGFTRPTRITILGQELAGEVEAAGKDVKLFKEGDQVFAAPGFRLGAYAEYICLAEKPADGALALKPANLTCEEAAAVPIGGFEALHFLRQANIQPGQNILIYGAGGSIGTIAIQLARSYGAEVTGVDRGEKLDMLRSTGADHVVDYTQEDFSQSDKTYDVIFDVVGKSPFSGSLRALKPGGCYLIANPSLTTMARRWLASGGKRVILGTSSYLNEDLIYLKELVEAGKIKPVIDRRYPLEQIAEAHRYVESGRKQGNVVIVVE